MLESAGARDGKDSGKLNPAKFIYKKMPDSPTTEVAIRRSFAEDLYIVLAGYEVSEQSAILDVTVNPLINWIWGGIGIIFIGIGAGLAVGLAGIGTGLAQYSIGAAAARQSSRNSRDVWNVRESPIRARLRAGRSGNGST